MIYQKNMSGFMNPDMFFQNIVSKFKKMNPAKLSGVLWKIFAKMYIVLCLSLSSWQD